MSNKTVFPLFVVAIIVVSTAETARKRGIYENDFGTYQPYNDVVYHAPSPVVYQQKIYIPSSAEIASAIQAAKEATSAVMAAQQRVQDAKNDILNQQHIATNKQTQAALALQKAEAAAAVQQQEAKSAATSLVQAQQRLAQAKQEVANLQRFASAKEAYAAQIIEKSANAAAIQIQRNDELSRKLSAIQQTNSAAIKQVAASKDGSLSATAAAVAAAADHGDSNHGVQYVSFHPWG